MVAPAHADRVRHVVEPAVVGQGLVLEDVTVRRAGARSVVEVVLDVTEDDDGGLDLDRVADATRAVSDALDAADVITGEYTLDVMSPGVDRPLTERRHFTRAVGHLLTVTLADGRTLAGRLTEVDRTGPDDAIVVVPVTPGRKGRKPVVGEPVRVPLSDVRRGRVEVDLSGIGPVDDDEADGAAAGEES
ncbi:ribosome maturation factor RimP [Cellulomonas fengjieae]|uniref:Ribosome maturation factor RimP n=1 Tax=Cellulomonas fengjieae TaxID=2819978 RepID=A0ABS3SHG5_9CELL|nr:ribosome maturation factor RimP [Cellulomonas fengjieae]MBO3084411.1 ribosome maturation factor RimP [Cellulomonas fengjieae]QVI67244.1 ribosome maturation factor RimP [Cellulomonas fengjieae]